jgi:hypothetical protein
MTRSKLLLAVAATTLLAVPAARAEQPHAFKGDRQVTVMTQNLYLGTDLNPIFGAASLPALFAAVGAGCAQVQANDFPARAQAIADEIAAAKPDLVGLQEAELYRTDVPPDGSASPAGTVAYDFIRCSSTRSRSAGSPTSRSRPSTAPMSSCQRGCRRRWTSASPIACRCSLAPTRRRPT